MKKKIKEPKKITKKLQGKSGVNIPVSRFSKFPLSYMSKLG